MKAFILLIPLAAFAAVLFLAFRFRGGLSKVSASVIGVVVGLLVGVFVLSAVLPDLSEEDLAKNESEKAARETVALKAKDLQRQNEEELAEIRNRQVPQSALDRITLIYINHKIYANNPVDCVSKVFGVRSVVGCMASTLNGPSDPHVWLYEKGKFKSLNGSARGLAQTKLSNEADISVMTLPLPKDIDVENIVDSFKNG